MDKIEIWDWASGHKPATEVGPNTTLRTKDGRVIGNAIVIKQLNTLQEAPAAAEYLEQTSQKIWLVETDFGNQMKLSTNEIIDWWHLGFLQDYNAWFMERLAKVQANISFNSNT